MTKTQPPADLNTSDDGHQLRMSFFGHLEELRQRLVRAGLALAVGTIIGVIVGEAVFGYLLQPYCRIDAVGDCRLQTLGPTESIISYFRVALLTGAALAMPVITYQFMLFIFPGLTHRERRTILLALPAITLLFAVGVAFAWFVLMPPALDFLQTFQPALFRAEWTADLYLSFVTSLIFWMGVAFEMPLIFFVLALMGLVQARLLIRHWRIAIIASAFLAALITPTVDPVNMMLVMGPLLGLYTISVGLVWLGNRRNAR